MSSLGFGSRGYELKSFSYFNVMDDVVMKIVMLSASLNHLSHTHFRPEATSGFNSNC